jgi:ubiquitin carboxyl-terminal hydrolase 2/21
MHRSISLEPQKFEQGRVRGVVGLVNLGNTCFMNSCLQCLCSTPPLLAFFSSPQYKAHLNPRSRCDGRLANAFGQLVHGIRFGAARDVLRPSEVKRVVATIAPRFSGYAQHDVQEFLQFLLDGLHDDLNLVTVKPAYEAIKDVAGESDAATSARWWTNYTQRNDSFISDLFAGQLKSTVQCTKCRHTSTAFDPMWDISVPVPSRGADGSRAVSLYDCFEAYTQRELLKGNEQYYCSRCRRHQDSYKQLCVYRYPHVLVVHIKRFSTSGSLLSGSRRSKITTNIKFPLRGFDLSEFAVHDDGQPHVIYDCFAVANHSGGLGGGHYTAYAKVSEQQWALFNDESASLVDESRIGGPEAYVLFYRRREGSATSGGR